MFKILVGESSQHELGGRKEVANIEEIAHRIGTETFPSSLTALVEGRDLSNREPRAGDVGEPQRDPG